MIHNHITFPKKKKCRRTEYCVLAYKHMNVRETYYNNSIRIKDEFLEGTER